MYGLYGLFWKAEEIFSVFWWKFSCNWSLFISKKWIQSYFSAKQESAFLHILQIAAVIGSQKTFQSFFWDAWFLM